MDPKKLADPRVVGLAAGIIYVLLRHLLNDFEVQNDNFFWVHIGACAVVALSCARAPGNFTVKVVTSGLLYKIPIELYEITMTIATLQRGDRIDWSQTVIEMVAHIVMTLVVIAAIAWLIGLVKWVNDDPVV